MKLSIVVCVYNSEKIIISTLNALLFQCEYYRDSIEIIVVDNNCTDKTVELVRRIDKKYSANLIVIEETCAGLMNARMSGFRRSRGDFILFVDDDNIIHEKFIDRLFGVFEKFMAFDVYCSVGTFSNPNISAELRNIYGSIMACGPIRESSGELDNSIVPYGACCCFKKILLDRLFGEKFQFLTMGRKGDKQSAGDDHELLLLAKIMGARMYFDTLLRFDHKLATARFTKDKLISLCYGVGESWAINSGYRQRILNSPVAKVRSKFAILKHIFVLISTNEKSKVDITNVKFKRYYLAKGYVCGWRITFSKPYQKKIINNLSIAKSVSVR